MKISTMMGGAAAALLLAACGEAADETADAGATPAALSGPVDGWTRIGDASWTVEDGEIVGIAADTGASFIFTEETYEDFRITLEFAITEPGNSGVFFNCEGPAIPLDTTCYEANIFDNRPDQSGRTGAIVNIAPPMATIQTGGGQWNTYDITKQGDHIVVVLNGETTVDIHDSTHTTPGPIGLQAGTGTVRFRNIEITPL